MGQQSLIYSFVARGTVVLAEYTEFTGNFTSIASQCLQKLPATNNKFTYNCDGHTFNYLVDNGFTTIQRWWPSPFSSFIAPTPTGMPDSVASAKVGVFHIPLSLTTLPSVAGLVKVIWIWWLSLAALVTAGKVFMAAAAAAAVVLCAWTIGFRILLGLCAFGFSQCLLGFLPPFAYCVVAVEAVGRQVPIAFLERIKEDFTGRYGGGKAATAVANSLNKEFGSKLKEHMQYCVDHPEEISKLAKVKAQVSEVKGVMMENIEKVLDRGEKIELLVDKTENLRSQAQDFRQQGTQMRRKMWLQNMKVKLIVLGILIALILIIVLSVCNGFKC
ncbi:hypothetical protein DVH24_028628 [Malus domestica]|uniref:V-SNARE coiled-coil homology domain-containing protein n=1 Tax=Malus domestica TaxID=3750 RepID=A0A498IUR5_MALDO|nr:hypothetical protein DVH24_028628 [Malus domestica]